jgi:outer membrane protein assembly factor BamB
MIASRFARTAALLALFAIPTSLGCLGLGKGPFPVLRGEREIERYASPRVRLVWHRVVNRGGSAPYRPVETASATLDPVRGRIYIGSTAGFLYAYDARGRRLFEYHAEESIESAAALDPKGGLLYLGTADGMLHAIDAESGERKWKVDIGFPIEGTPLLAGDALYLVSAENAVVAVSRKDGASLFSYKRPRGEDFTIRGRAGLTLVDDMILAGFDDGAIVALDANDGSVRWLYDTSDDLPEARGKRPSFGDVDTTPVVIDRVVYAASFSAGLYRLDLDNGSVIKRDPERKGITNLLAVEKTLLMTSPSAGLVAWDTTQDRELWRRPRERGALSEPIVTEGDIVLYGESPGSFLAVDFMTGEELARIEGSEGFAARASAAWNLAAVLGNGGTFYTLKVD